MARIKQSFILQKKNMKKKKNKIKENLIRFYSRKFNPSKKDYSIYIYIPILWDFENKRETYNLNRTFANCAIQMKCNFIGQ